MYWCKWKVCNPRLIPCQLKLIRHRNGGHVNPIIYEEYEDLKHEYGIEGAKKILRFRLKHFAELAKVIEEEGLLEETQWRAVEHCEVYFDPDQLQAAQTSFKAFATDMPEEAAKFKLYDAEEAIKASGPCSDLLYWL